MAGTPWRSASSGPEARGIRLSSFNERIDEALGVIGRLTAFGVATLAVVFVSGIALKPVFPAGVPPGLEGRILVALIITFAVTVAHVIVVAMLERADWTLSGFHTSAWHPGGLALGLAAGAMAVALPGALLFWSGQLTSVPSLDGLWLPFALGTLGVFAALAAVEELIFRGYPFGLLADRWGAGVAVGMTSLAFAVLHAFNPGATAVSLLCVGVAGLFLGAVRLATGSVVAAWLAHLAINWVQAVGFRLPVSGVELRAAPGFRLESTGPDWLTGGRWGLEGGVAAASALLVISFLLFRARPTDAGRAHRR